MNILKKKFFIKKDRTTIIKREGNNLIIENNSNNEVTVIVPKVFKVNNANFKIEFGGDIINSDNGGAIAKLVSKTGKVFLEIPFNSNLYVPKKANFFMVAIRVMPNSKIVVKKFNVEFVKSCDAEILERLSGDTVIIAPAYPSVSQKYNFSFVHSKVREYKKLGWNVDVVSASEDEETVKYNFEGIDVTKTGYLNVRNILQKNKYKRIIVHFFTEEIANVIDSVDTSNSEIYIYSHGSDLLYRDINVMDTKYFEQTKSPTNEQVESFERKDCIIERYNNKENVKWIFGTNWAKERAERLNNIKLNKCNIIPCVVDDEIFEYSPKTEADRTKIFTIKKFDNFNTYSVDVLVRTILELSKRECFSSLEFNIYGDGSEHDRLVAPLRKFKNVNIYKRFLSHSEIAEAHKHNGIGFFPTRYETQGVSASEAAMSGLAVISGNIAAVPEVFENSAILCNSEDFMEYANKIEELYNNPQMFMDLSRRGHDCIINKYGKEIVFNKEMQMYNNSSDMKVVLNIPEKENDAVLTIAIASYNVEQYLRNGVLSLLNSKVASKLEILIINDGSKDNTAIIGKELEDLSTVNGKSIVKLIDKPNGGHGSALNKGIELATGKYIKFMDGDDYFDTAELEKLVGILENENSDIVLNNYVEDLAIPSKMNQKYLYNFMNPGHQYNIEDLCDAEYGFNEWGPLLSTSTYKTKMMQDGNFKISEKCFYVDMELNTYSFINAKTISYYPLNIYIYFIGRAGQSISKESYTKNYKHHEHVTLKIIEEYYNYSSVISENKKAYLKRKIILPLVKCQYMVSTVFFKNGIVFRSFDQQLKKYPEFYKCMNDFEIKINRAFNGHLIRYTHLINAIKNRLKLHGGE